MLVLFAVLAGMSLGYVLERGDMCFHSTLRGLFRVPRQMDLFRAYVLVILISAPSIFVMRNLGWIDPWIPPFAWQANLLGGLIFGAGMVVASSCITGLFYKLGHGMLGTLVGLSAWVLGDIAVYLGPLSDLRSSLTIASQTLTLDSLLGPVSWILLPGIGLVAAFWLFRSPQEGRDVRGKQWGWLPLGIAAGMVISVSWLLADFNGENYPYGTSYVPSGIYQSLAGKVPQGYSPWIPIALISLVPGALLAAIRSKTLWFRGETANRYLALGAGGFLMGAGAALAGGCNLGHSLVGVPLLSLGSLITTLAMAAGVYLTDRIARRIFPEQAPKNKS